MAVNVGSVEVLLTLRDMLSQQLAKPTANLVKLSGEIRKVDAQLNKHAQEAEKLARAHDTGAAAVGRFGRQIGTTLIHVAAAGLAYKALGAAVRAVSDQVEFVRTFEKIENVTGVARAEVGKFRSEINALSTATGKGPQELAEGFYAIASAGLDGARATEVLTQAARASAVGLGETKDIARSITAALNAYGAENLSAADAANQLFIAVREGGAEASEMAGVFGRVVAIANDLGVSFAEVGASVATFTRLGVGADEAVTALRGTIASLLTPTRNQEEALNAIGMSMAMLRKKVREEGLAVALTDLAIAFNGNEDAMGAVFPNMRALAGVLANAGSQAEEYREIVRKMSTDNAALSTAFKDVSQSASFRWDQLVAQLKQVALMFGEQVLPAVLKVGDAISSLDASAVNTIAQSISIVADVLSDVIGVWNSLPEGLRDFLTGTGGIGQLDAFNRQFTEQRKQVAGNEGVRGFFNSLFDDDAYGSTERLNQAAFADAARHQREVLAGLEKEAAFRAHAREMVEKLTKEQEQQAQTQKQTNDEQSKAAAALAQRGAEVLANLRNQSAVAAEQLALAVAKAAGDKEAVAAIEEQLTNRQIQLEVERTIAGLDNQKAQASRELRAQIEAEVAARIRAEKAAERAVETERLRTIEIRNQETLETQLLRIAISRREAEDAIKRALQDQGKALQDQLIDAFDMLDNSREYLNALVTGGRQAARVVELQQQYLAEYGDANTAMAEAVAAAEAEQEKLNYLISRVGELAKPAWQLYMDAAFDALDAIGSALSDVITQAAMEGKVNWESVWEGLKSSLIQIFADMLAEMLKRWIAKQLAMRAASQAIQAGGGGLGALGGASAGAGGGMGSLGSLAGAGSQAGMSASTMAGLGVAAFALYVVYKGFIEDHKRKFASVTLGSTGQIISSAQHGKKYMQGVQDAAAAILKGLTDWLAEMDVMMTSFGQVTVEHSASGWQVIAQGTRMAFATAEEAMSAAQAFMVRFGEFAEGVPDLIRSAVNATRDMNMDAITSNIQFARTLLTQNMEQVALGMNDATQLFIDQMHRSFDLFASSFRGIDTNALMQATGSAMLHFANSIQALYDQLTGKQEDPRKAAERQRQAYNMQRAVMIAQIMLLYEEIKARVAAVQSQIALIQVLNGWGGGGGGGGVGGPRPTQMEPGEYTNAKGGGVLRVDERNPTNNPQLAALLTILDNLARVLAGLPPEIPAGGVKPGGGAGGGRRRQQREQEENVRSFIDDMRFQLSQAALSPLSAEIEAIRRNFAEQLEAAKENIALRNELLDLERQAIDAARERFQVDVQARVDDALGRNTAFVQLRKKFADLRAAIFEAGFAADKAVPMLRDLVAAEEEAVRILSQQMSVDILGGLAQYIQDETEKQKFLAAAAQIKFELDMVNYRAQFAILKAQGTVAQAVLDKIQEAFDYIDTHPPIFGPTGGGITDTGDNTPGGGGSGGHWVFNPRTKGWTWVSDTGPDTSRRDNALALLARYQSEALSKWHQALNALNKDFATIREALGDTPEIAAAYTDAFNRLRESFLDGLRDLHAELTSGELFGDSVTQQFESARSTYQRLLSSVMGGDLSQADALNTAARRYLDLAAQMFDTSTMGFAGVKQGIVDELALVLGGGAGIASNVIGGPAWFAQASQLQLESAAAQSVTQVAATNNLATVIDIASKRQEMHLKNMDDKLAAVIERMDLIVASASTTSMLTVGTGT